MRLSMQQQASTAHMSPLSARPEVVHVLLVPVAVLQLGRRLRGRVRGEVREAAHALGPGGAGQRPRGRRILWKPGLVSLHPLNIIITINVIIATIVTWPTTWRPDIPIPEAFLLGIPSPSRSV